MDQKVLCSIASIVGSAPVLALIVQLELTNPELGRLFGQIEHESTFDVLKQFVRCSIDEQFLVRAKLDLLLIHVALMLCVVQALLACVHRIDRHTGRPVPVPEDKRDLVAVHLVDAERSIDLSAILTVAQQFNGRGRGVTRFKITGQTNGLAYYTVYCENGIFGYFVRACVCFSRKEVARS